MNAVPYAMLSNMPPSIALLNLINGVLIRHHHCFYYAIVGICISDGGDEMAVGGMKWWRRGRGWPGSLSLIRLLNNV